MKHRLSACFLIAVAVLATANPGIGQDLPETGRYDLRGVQVGMVIEKVVGLPVPEAP